MAWTPARASLPIRASHALRKWRLIVSSTTSGNPEYIAAVAIVPPPAPSVIRRTSPGAISLRAVRWLVTPTAPTQPVIRDPRTMSPPIRKVEPVTRGTPIASPTAVTPAV